jgi:steroid 5-alpha reductase family enzyme
MVFDALAPLIAVLGFMFVVMASAWLYQRAVANGGWTDVFWTFGSGASGVAVALWPAADAYGPRQAFVAVLAAAWALRLGLYMARRVAAGPEDVRYTRLREEWRADFQPRMAKFLLTQAPVTVVLCVAIYLAAHRPSVGLDLRDALGFAILACAIIGEATADSQMRRFKAEHKGEGRVCDAGLWAWSRHPNYFFEWLGWAAYPVIAIHADDPWSFASLAAPAMMFVVLTRVTGVQLLEAAMLRSRGDAYRHYQDRVSAFFPLPPKRSR